MNIIVTIIFGIISSSVAIAVSHYLYYITSNPKVILELKNSKEKEQLCYAYYALVFIGWYVLTYAGFKLFLFWIPSSIGGLNQDGNYTTLRDYIAMILALLSFQILINLEKSSENKNESNQSD
jgi:hypothetical protein